jgi:spermidine synthase
MLIDGAMMVTTRDNFFYHEMMAHAPLFTHPNPRNVVIIGGGDCGTLREVLRHPGVQTAVQCDIDEQVTRMAEKYFPELCESNGDPRATVMFDDGIAYMANAAPESIDVIIVDSTDPVGPAEGLFNQAFYANCLKALRPDGLLVQQSESPLALMHLILEMRSAMRAAGFKDFRVLPFPQPCYPTGWWSCLIASKQSRDLTQFRKADAAAKRFETKYYTADVHQGALALPPFVAKALAD